MFNPRVIDVGTGDDQSNWIAPGVLAPNQPPQYDPAKDKQVMFDQGTAGGSAYSSYGGSSRFPFPGGQGGNGFASILGSLLGGNNRLSNLPGMPTPQTPDLGAGQSQGQADAPVGSSGISPALTAVMRDTTTTGGAENSTIQSIMAKLLQQKRRTPPLPTAY